MRESREYITIGINVVALIVAAGGMVINYLIHPDDKALNSYRIPLVVIAVMLGAFSAYMARKSSMIRSKKRVFIMYSHKDIDAAQQLVSKLREAGITPWFDRDEITPGQRIDEAIANGILQCSAAVLLNSKSTSQHSRFLDLELELALKTMPSKSAQYSPIVPVRLDDEPLPNELKYVNSLKLDDDKDFDRLIAGLRLILDSR